MTAGKSTLTRGGGPEPSFPPRRYCNLHARKSPRPMPVSSSSWCRGLPRPRAMARCVSVRKDRLPRGFQPGGLGAGGVQAPDMQLTPSPSPAVHAINPKTGPRRGTAPPGGLAASCLARLSLTTWTDRATTAPVPSHSPLGLLTGYALGAVYHEPQPDQTPPPPPLSPLPRETRVACFAPSRAHATEPPRPVGSGPRAPCTGPVQAWTARATDRVCPYMAAEHASARTRGAWLRESAGP